MTRSSDQSRLILVEGLPGTGKTTLAQKLAGDLRAAGREVVLFLEGDLHPCDLQWISRLSKDDFDAAIDHLRQHWLRSKRSESWEDILERLRLLSAAEEGMVLTAYTKLGFVDTQLWSGLDPFRDGEVHDARVDADTYREVYLRRWQRFGAAHKHDEAVFIFECAFLQSHVTELLAYRSCGSDDIVVFLDELIEPVRHMQPELYYIRARDYPACIRHAAAGREGWLDGVVSYIENSPYGKAQGLNGFDGAISFFSHRSEIEQQAMESLRLPVQKIVR